MLFTVVPEAGERELELWFENYTGASSSCRVWDSAYGANYRFSVLQPPDWMGQATPRLTRDTSSRCGSFPSDGLGIEVLYGTGTRQRSAIRNICFEVYQHGVTDGPSNALWQMLDVRAHLSASSGGSEEWQHIPLVDRVGNNARYALDLGQVDPLRRYHCPTVPSRVENGSEIAAMSLYFSVNGAVLAEPDGAPTSASSFSR